MIEIRYLGLQPYEKTWNDMKSFTCQRDMNTPDELWVLEHLPVYTQGQAGKAEHILDACAIPIIHSDRGGQVTYHAPGQLVIYVLMDIRRRNLAIRSLVTKLEGALISLLNYFDISANSQCGAPGVYVDDKKIASIGLRVKNGCTYHGIALNVAMDLSPFSGINPCGYTQLQMTQMSYIVQEISIEEVRNQLENFFSPIFEH